jgi:hypothetical protein
MGGLLLAELVDTSMSGWLSKQRAGLGSRALIDDERWRPAPGLANAKRAQMDTEGRWMLKRGSQAIG